MIFGSPATSRIGLLDRVLQVVTQLIRMLCIYDDDADFRRVRLQRRRRRQSQPFTRRSRTDHRQSRASDGAALPIARGDSCGVCGMGVVLLLLWCLLQLTMLDFVGRVGLAVVVVSVWVPFRLSCQDHSARNK